MWTSHATWRRALLWNNMGLRLILILLTVLIPLTGNQNWFKSRSNKDKFQKAVEHYNDERYAIAETILKDLLESQTGDVETAALMLWMKSLYRLEKLEEAKEVGRLFLKQHSVSRYTQDVQVCFGDIFIHEGSYSSAYRMYLSARQNGTGTSFLNQVDRRLINTIKLTIPTQVIEELMAVIHGETERSILLLTRAYGEIYTGRPDDAAITLSQVQPGVVPNQFFNLYEQLLLASYKPARRMVTIGVICPLSGDDREKGRQFLKGLKDAIQEWPDQSVKVSLVVLDNYNNEIRTIQAVRSLETNPMVLAIIGPLNPKNALVAANSVYGRTIPLLIPSAIQNQLTELSDNVFQLNSNLDTRGKLAAQVAVKVFGMEHVAIIAPADKFGENLTDAFIKELDLLGKNPVAVEWYSGVPEDLSRQFQVLRKVAFDLQEEEAPYEEILGMEIDSLDALFDVSVEGFFDLPEEESSSMTRADSNKIVLESIQGIYIPIHRDHLSYLGTQFPFHNLNARLIGNEGWQDLDVLNQEIIGPHINGMVLLSSQLPRILLPGQTEMNDPGLMPIYYQGYDSALLLITTLGMAAANRDAIRSRLATMDEFRGIAHTYAFGQEEPNLNTALQLIEYRQSSFHGLGYFKGDSLILYHQEAP